MYVVIEYQYTLDPHDPERTKVAAVHGPFATYHGAHKFADKRPDILQFDVFKLSAVT